MVFGRFRSKSNKEVARQDVMVTPKGPVELYRRDQNGQARQLPRETVKQLNQYQAPPREPYQNRYRPIHTAHGPGLYRNHQIVRGDTIEMQKFNRQYIYHRKPFDWYNIQRSNLIDDIEEILEPNRNTYEVTNDQRSEYPSHQYGNPYAAHSDYDYNYDPNQNYSSRRQKPRKSASCSRRRPEMEANNGGEQGEDDTIYIVKKNEKRCYQEEQRREEEPRQEQRNGGEQRQEARYEDPRQEVRYEEPRQEVRYEEPRQVSAAPIYVNPEPVYKSQPVESKVAFTDARYGANG